MRSCNTHTHLSRINHHKAVHPALEIPRPFKQWFFLEIFSGSARLAACMHRHVPLVVKWDILFGPQYDLTKVEIRHIVFGWLLADWILGLHLGTPCASFSRARDQPNGPPRLRSDSPPLGLTSLRPCDAIAVSIGNCLMRFSAKCMRICLTRHIPASLENLRMSRLWICPAIRSLLRSRSTSFEYCDFCMFGIPWRKSTGILGCFLDLSGLTRFQCRGCPPGACARSKLRHFVLSGVDSTGQFWTKRAEPYPPRFCTLLSKIYANCFARLTAEGFWRYASFS